MIKIEEYLIPNKYKGDGYGISVMFAGLNDEKYDYLKTSIDGANYVEVERDTLNSYHSVPINFTGLESGVLYRVFGKFSVNGIINDVECSILSQDGTDDDVFDVEAFKKNIVVPEPSNVQTPIVVV